jgi:hypothetical protein
MPVPTRVISTLYPQQRTIDQRDGITVLNQIIEDVVSIVKEPLKTQLPKNEMVHFRSCYDPHKITSVRRWYTSEPTMFLGRRILVVLEFHSQNFC